MFRDIISLIRLVEILKSTQLIDSESQRNTLYEEQCKSFANAMKDLS
ncbi:hypothetical protein O185_23175 [Photorhabdus temperata J3]|uniref:Uncharacterized protein n=1 Tax=Photorhabdus temperata J3 TaxID=1389415 RepID=U7QS92_PHOTE|nr:hypothetical protein O185_23175 [Photorhabdus temperata J3]